MGVTLWALLSTIYEETTTRTVPLCFFNTEQVTVTAPETVSVTLKGLRRDLRAIDYTILAIHLDATKLHEGKNSVLVHNKELFLPKKIKLVNYTPINLEVTVVKK